MGPETHECEVMTHALFLFFKKYAESMQKRIVFCEDCRTIWFHHLLGPSSLKLKEPLQAVTRKRSSSVALETRECEVVTHALFFFHKI